VVMAIAVPMLIVSSIEPFPDAMYMHAGTQIESRTAGLAGR
jgi:hypothetical protein